MKKLMALFLALFMLAAMCLLAAGCTDGNKETTTTTKTSETTTTTNGSTETTGNGSETETTKQGDTTTTTTDDSGSLENWNGKTHLPGYLDVDFGGDVFLIASRADESTGGWNNGREIWVESLNNEAVHDAVYERNETMKTLYNCTIMVDDGGWENGFNADVAAGGGKYISGCSAYQVGGSFTNGNFYNVLNLDIDFTQSWWDQAFFRDLSCNGKLYGLSGDFAYHAMRAAWIMFYNKDLYENSFPDTDIYQLVRDHKWTIDALLAMCQAVKSDNNGDQAITYSAGADADTVGLMTTAHNIRGLYNACGEFYVAKNDAGKMISALDSGKGSDVIDKIRTLTTDDSYLEIGYTSVHAAMKNGTTLFAGEVMGTLEVMAEQENLRIGVVPQPLYDENQTSYYHYVNNQAAFYAIPTSYANMQDVADFFTLFAAHSQKIVRTAFVNTYKYVYASDEDSAEMVDLILNTRTYDPGYHFNMALGFDGVLPSMCSKDGKNQFSAAAKRYSSAVTDLIEKYETRIAAIDDPV